MAILMIRMCVAIGSYNLRDERGEKNTREKIPKIRIHTLSLCNYSHMEFASEIDSTKFLEMMERYSSNG